MRHIILADAGEPEIIHWNRPEAGPWAFRTIEGIEAALEIAETAFRCRVVLSTFVATGVDEVRDVNRS